LGFQVGHPVLVSDLAADVTGKEMNVIRHDHVTAQKPCRSVCGNVAEDAVEVVACQDRPTMLYAERVKDDGRLVVDILDAMHRMPASREGVALIWEGEAPAEP
jgi:hypothetical protein